MTSTTANYHHQHQGGLSPLEMEEEEEEEHQGLLETETYTFSEDASEDFPSDEDEEDDYSSEDDDDDEDSTVWKDALVHWRQHAVAMMVAVVATILAWNHSQSEPTTTTTTDNLFGSHDESLSPVFASTFRHEHLDDYKRTANISFCPSTSQSRVEKQLELMEFHLPLDTAKAFQLHYVADALEDDDYSRVLGRSESQLPQPNTIMDPEYHCLRQLESSTTKKSYITGATYFFQPPSYVEMYPHLRVEDDDNDDNDNQPNMPITGITPFNKNKKRHPKPASLSFTGFAAKFINLSPHPVLLHWDGKGGKSTSAQLVGEIAPFCSLGTATTPGQSFSVSPVYDSSHALDRWIVTADDAVQVFEDTSQQHKWTTSDFQLYHLQQANLEFAKHYLIASHRTWLAHFPRAFPVHPMRPAHSVGEKHDVTLDADDANESRTLTMEVVSVTPRVLSIDDFLTPEECDALMSLAAAQGLKGSTLYAGGMAQQQRDVSTRSSTNAWLSRETSKVTDRIYHRAAQILGMKETLLQQPAFYQSDEDEDEEAPHHDYTQHSIAESLQVVRYQTGEEYTAHHDFVYPSLRHRYQPTRYATLLLYLNDDFLGGETNFPRAVNPTQHDGITITPKAGKAVLFYNMLPDGNVDDLSQHQSLPVLEGEKWLANLWVWEPVIN